jgi:hypothetical protein
VGDPTTEQVHDFEPGILPSGLFWTVPIARSAIASQPGHGRARWAESNMAVPDFHDFLNAVSPAPTSVPGHVSFDVRWTPGGAAQKINDAVFGFAGRFIPSVATIRFAVSDDGTGVVYKSDDAGQVTIGGGVGKERNGVFFDCGKPLAASSAASVDRRSCWSR